MGRVSCRLDAGQRIRTTVTLDADVAVQFERLMKEQGLGFKEALNLVLRRGFAGKDARPLAAAWAQVEEWWALEPVWTPAPTARHAELLGRLRAEARVTDGNRMPDLHLAALALEHGLTVVSTDGDFARFKRLKLINPLG